LKFEKKEKDRIEKEKERERSFELEKTRFEKEVEVQRSEVQMGLVNREQGENGNMNGSQGGHNHSNGLRLVAMKALKLPPFNEEKDDLDASLMQFERACTAFDVRPEYWSAQLARLLQGRSLEVFQHLTDVEVDDCKVLKAQLDACCQ